MIVIVGHGPSILTGLGSVIDTHTVVRLKHGRMGKPEHWGRRTDYLCGRSLSFAKPGIPFWFFGDEIEEKWRAWFAQFDPHFENEYGRFNIKPSHGLCAAFCAMEYLQPTELAFIGCDQLMNPDGEFRKWNSPRVWTNPHDWHAEHRALHALGVRIVELTHAQQEQSAGPSDGSLRARIGLRELPANESREGVQQGRQEERHPA